MLGLKAAAFCQSYDNKTSLLIDRVVENKHSISLEAIRYSIGLSLYFSKEYSRSINLLEKIDTNTEFASKASLLLHYTYFSLGDKSKALEWGLKSLSTADSILPFFEVSTNLKSLGLFSESNQVLISSLEYAKSKKDWVDVYSECANISLKNNDLDNAEKHIKLCIEKLPKRQSLYIQLAKVQHRKRQFSQAAESLIHANEIREVPPECLIYIGEYFLKNGDLDKAKNYYGRALTLGNEGIRPEYLFLLEKPSQVEERCPKSLLTVKRLDLVVKYLYVKHYLQSHLGNSLIDPLILYKKIIKRRTNGKEPDNFFKTTVGSYVVEFRELIRSVKKNGLSLSCPIPINEKSELLNGSHRLAIALALGLENVPVFQCASTVRKAWDFEWFLQNGFTEVELSEIISCWIDINKSSARIAILWSPVVDSWSEISKTLSDNFEILAERVINFNKDAFSEFIKEVYTDEKLGDSKNAILKKIAFLESYESCIKVVVYNDHSHKSVSIKKEIRSNYHNIIPKDNFATIHCTENSTETAHVQGLIFHNLSLNLLRRRSHTVTNGLLNRLVSLSLFLREMDIPKSEVCIVGGAVMDLYGYRSSDDIDIVLSSHYRNKYYDKNQACLCDGVDLVRSGYAKGFKENISDDSLIFDRANFVHFRGFKFATLEIVVNRKVISGRKKDMRDLFLFSNNSWNSVIN